MIPKEVLRMLSLQSPSGSGDELNIDPAIGRAEVGAPWEMAAMRAHVKSLRLHD